VTLTKAEMIERICTKHGVSKDDAIKIVPATFEIIKGALERAEQVKLVGFGTFTVVSRAPQKGRHVKTGSEIVIPRRKALRFKASPMMKKAVNRALTSDNGTSLMNVSA
jgi:nucleoid DNA-binding protein